MERLMNLPPYKKHSTANGFNNRYVVQLTSNYRSHSAILQPSNVLFYENTLKAVADPGPPFNRQTSISPRANNHLSFQIPQISTSERLCCHRQISQLFSNRFRASVIEMAAGTRSLIISILCIKYCCYFSLYNDEESDIVLSYVRQLLDGKIKGLSSKNSRIIQYSKQVSFECFHSTLNKWIIE